MEEQDKSQETPQSESVQGPEIQPSLFEMEHAQNPFASLDAPPPDILPFMFNGMPPAVGYNNSVRGNIDSIPQNVNFNKPGEKIDELFNWEANPAFGPDSTSLVTKGSFGTGHKNANFYRYYKHRKFDELGFHPYRDNEAYYNEKGSWLDDTLRAAGQWANLIGTGFKSVLPVGGISSQEASRQMEEAMAIGNSTRGGLGGWMNNFALNSAYTFGILGEMYLEGLALGAIEFLSGGTATPVVAAETGRMAMGIGKIYKAWKGLNKTIKGLKNVDAARDFFTLTRAKKFGGKVANFVNPFERTTANIRGLVTNTGEISKLGNFATTVRSFGDFYRDIREIQVAASEAWMEGYGAKDRYYDQLVNEYYAEHGVMPDDATHEEFVKRAEGVKNNVGWANLFTIYATNKIVFDSIKPLRPGTKMTRALKRGGSKDFAMTAAKDFIAAETNAFTEGMKKNWLKQGKDFLLKSAYSPISKRYFAANLAEGIQESSQEAIQEAAIYYADMIDQDPSNIGFYGMMGAVAHGVGEQFSAQGFDTFLQGYLMGSLVQGSFGAANYGFGKAKNLVTGTDPHKAYQEQVDGTNESIINAANHIAANALAYSDIGIKKAGEIKVATAAANESAEQGDVKTQKDLEKEARVNHFYNLARNGSMDLVTLHIDDMLTLSDAELADAYGMPKSQGAIVRGKLNKLKNEAVKYQKRYDQLTEERPNPFTPWQYSKEKNAEKYYDELFKYIGYEGAVEDLIGNVEHYEDAVDRLMKIGQDLETSTDKFKGLLSSIKGSRIKNMEGEWLSLLIDNAQRDEKLEILKTEIDLLKEGDTKDQKKAADLQQTYDLLKDFDTLAKEHVKLIEGESKANSTSQGRKEVPNRAKLRKGAVVRRKFRKKGPKKRTVRDPEVEQPETVKGGRVVQQEEERLVVEGVTDDGKLIVTINGKKREYKPGYFTLVEPAKERPKDFEDYGDDESLSLAMMYDAFYEYMQHAAKMSDGVIFDTQLEEAFRHIKDAFYLQRDTRNLGAAINILSDPNYFDKYVDVKARIANLREQRRVENLKKALEKFRKSANTNDLINDLADLNIFVTEEQIENITKDLSLVTFYDADTLEAISYTSEKYGKILDIIELYEENTGIIVRGKPIAQAVAEAPGYTSFARLKNSDDKRTLKQLGKQFGFNPEKESEVSLQQVLKAVAESPQSTPEEIALARRLLHVMKGDKTVTFVTNASVPGQYFDAEDKIVIDPRYSSEDYTPEAAGRVNPLEYHILRQAVNYLTNAGLKSDKEFNDSITKLREKAIEYLRNYDQEEYKSKYGSMPLLGLVSNEQFVSAAMTNRAFQIFLSEIQYDNQGKSGWSKFVDAIKDFLKSVLDLEFENTVLNEALRVITNRIEGISLTEEEDGAGAPPPQAPSGQDIYKLDAEYPELVDKLVEIYKTVGDGNLPNSGKDATREEVIGTVEFQNMINTSPSMISAIKQYIGKTKPPVKKPPKDQPTFNQGTKLDLTGTVLVVSGTQIIEKELSNEPVVVLMDYRGEEGDMYSEEVEFQIVETGEKFLIDFSDKDSYQDISYVPHDPSRKKPVEKPEGEEGEETKTLITPEDKEAIDWVNSLSAEEQADAVNQADPRYQRVMEMYDEGLLLRKEEEAGEQLSLFGGKDVYYPAIEEGQEETDLDESIETPDDFYAGYPVYFDENIQSPVLVEQEEGAVYLNPIRVAQSYDDKDWQVPIVEGASILPDIPLFFNLQSYTNFLMEREITIAENPLDEWMTNNANPNLGAYYDYIHSVVLGKFGIDWTSSASVSELANSVDAFLNQYRRIRTVEDLKEWKIETDVHLMEMDDTFNQIFFTKYGKEFDSDTLTEMLNNKTEELANMITLESLTPDSVVYTNYKKYMVVMSNDSKTIILRPVSDYHTGNDQNDFVITGKSEAELLDRVKKYVSMSSNQLVEDFEYTPTEETITPEDNEDSKEIIEKNSEERDMEKELKDWEDIVSNLDEDDTEIDDYLKEC